MLISPLIAVHNLGRNYHMDSISVAASHTKLVSLQIEHHCYRLSDEIFKNHRPRLGSSELCIVINNNVQWGAVPPRLAKPSHDQAYQTSPTLSEFKGPARALQKLAVMQRCESTTFWTRDTMLRNGLRDLSWPLLLPSIASLVVKCRQEAHKYHFLSTHIIDIQR